MIRKFTSWEEMPGELIGRWLELRPLLLACLGKGMSLELVDHESVVNEALTPSEGAIFGDVGATYIRYSKRLIMTENVAYGRTPEYGGYRPDIHEIGHAVWFLLLTGWQKWLMYFPAYMKKEPFDAYAAESVEEGWAQDFEAFWTEGPQDSPINHGRAEFERRAPKRFGMMRQMLARFKN